MRGNVISDFKKLIVEIKVRFQVSIDSNPSSFETLHLAAFSNHYLYIGPITFLYFAESAATFSCNILKILQETNLNTNFQLFFTPLSILL